jgi:hypothetical protein
VNVSPTIAAHWSSSRSGSGSSSRRAPIMPCSVDEQRGDDPPLEPLLAHAPRPSGRQPDPVSPGK